MDRERMMKNVAEIFSRGAVEKNLPAWVNMRHAWKASDAARDRGLEYPANVVQIKNLDYKKELDEVRFNELIETWDKGVERNIIFFADSGMPQTWILQAIHPTATWISAFQYRI